MRGFTRPIIVCTHCGAKIHTGFGVSSRNPAPANDAHALWTGPPGITAPCPRCQGLVDTTSAYPVLPEFPPPFGELKAYYAEFTPKWEMSRDSFEVKLADLLATTKLEDVLKEFNTEEGPQGLRRDCAHSVRSEQAGRRINKRHSPGRRTHSARLKPLLPSRSVLRIPLTKLTPHASPEAFPIEPLHSHPDTCRLPFT